MKRVKDIEKSLMTLSKSSGLGIFSSAAEEWQKFSHTFTKKENDSRIV